MDNWSKLVVGSIVKFIGDTTPVSHSGFTKGKKYEVYARNEHGFTVLDDTGQMLGFMKKALGYTFKFKPKKLKVGDQLVWTGDSNIGHSKGKTYEIVAPVGPSKRDELFVKTDSIMYVPLVEDDPSWKLDDYPLANCVVGDLISCKHEDEDDTDTPQFIKDKPYKILAKSKRWFTVLAEGGWELYIHRKSYNWYPNTVDNRIPKTVKVGQHVVYVGSDTTIVTPAKQYVITRVEENCFAIADDNGVNTWFTGKSLDDVSCLVPYNPVPAVKSLQAGEVVICVSNTNCDVLTLDALYEVTKVDDHTYDLQEPTTGAVITNMLKAAFSDYFQVIKVADKKGLMELLKDKAIAIRANNTRVQRPVGSIVAAKEGDYIQYLGGADNSVTTLTEGKFYKVGKVSNSIFIIDDSKSVMVISKSSSQWKLFTRKEMELTLQKAVLQQIDDNLKIAYRLSDDEDECLSDDEVEKTTLFIWWHNDKGIRVSEECPGNSMVNNKARPIFGEMIPMMLEGIAMGHLVEMHYDGRVMEVEVYNCDEQIDDMDEDCENDWDEDEVPCSGCEKCKSVRL